MKGTGLLRNFSAFLSNRSVLDWAIGIVIGTAFGKTITSFVYDVLLPPVGLLFGKVDFRDLYINLSRTQYPNFTEAKNAGAPTINYGMFIGTVFDFLIVSFVVFLVVEQMQKMSGDTKVTKDSSDVDAIEIEDEFKTCPFCIARIPKQATRCRYCTSQLNS